MECGEATDGQRKRSEHYHGPSDHTNIGGSWNGFRDRREGDRQRRCDDPGYRGGCAVEQEWHYAEVAGRNCFKTFCSMIAVIADDLTGAAELGGIGLRYGLSVEVNMDVNLSTKADLLVIA